jgi:hypothetical protein
VGSVVAVEKTYPEDVERALLRGLIVPETACSHRNRKLLASRMRVRIVAVEYVLREGLRCPVGRIADAAHVTARHINLTFGPKQALFAFPPPELAVAIVATAATARTFEEIPAKLSVLFASLDRNTEVLALIAGTAELHRRHKELRIADACFAEQLRMSLQTHFPHSAAALRRWTGYVTDGIRERLMTWSQAGGTISAAFASFSEFLEFPEVMHLSLHGDGQSNVLSDDTMSESKDYRFAQTGYQSFAGNDGPERLQQ